MPLTHRTTFACYHVPDASLGAEARTPWPRLMVTLGNVDCNDPRNSQETGMYDALTNFLRTFSADYPILWALLVMVVIGGTGLGLYAFWEVVLKAASAVFGRSGNSHRDAQP